MTRGHMADPDIVQKLRRGQVDRIRPCVGARNCLDGALHGGSTVCIHNPATGREATVPQHVTPGTGRRLRVTVVGGGPGGLEAARVCALRGHAVGLFEAGERLGGQVLIAARARGRAEIGEIVGWLARENAHAGVAVQLGAFMEAADVLALRPDIVVDATGGLPATGDVHDPHGLLVSTWDVLTGARTVAGHVLFFDDHGGHQGLSCAATLAGCVDVRLTVATPERALGNGMGDVNRPQYLEPLYGSGATLLPDRELIAVVRDGNRVRAELHNTYTGTAETVAADYVVIEAGSNPNTALFDTLAPLAANRGSVDLALLAAGQAQPVAADGFTLWRVGDAVVHRGIHAAILEARRFCQNV